MVKEICVCGRVCVWVHARARMRVYACVCVYICVSVCVCGWLLQAVGRDGGEGEWRRERREEKLVNREKVGGIAWGGERRDGVRVGRTL